MVGQPSSRLRQKAAAEKERSEKAALDETARRERAEAEAKNRADFVARRREMAERWDAMALADRETAITLAMAETKPSPVLAALRKAIALVDEEWDAIPTLAQSAIRADLLRRDLT